VRNRGTCRNVDRVNRERCETRDERGTARDSARGVRRAMFSATVAFVSDRAHRMAEAFRYGFWRASCANRRTSEIVVNGRGGGVSVCYSNAYDGCMRRKREAGMAGGRKECSIKSLREEESA
jgi:hypothetical protein